MHKKIMHHLDKAYAALEKMTEKREKEEYGKKHEKHEKHEKHKAAHHKKSR